MYVSLYQNWIVSVLFVTLKYATRKRTNPYQSINDEFAFSITLFICYSNVLAMSTQAIRYCCIPPPATISLTKYTISDGFCFDFSHNAKLVLLQENGFNVIMNVDYISFLLFESRLWVDSSQLQHFPFDVAYINHIPLFVCFKVKLYSCWQVFFFGNSVKFY